MRKNLFFVLLSCFAFGQNKKIDSLRNELKKEKADKFLDHVELTNAFTQIGQLDSVFHYTSKVSKEAFKSNKTLYISKAYILESNAYFLKQDLKNAFSSAEKALQFSLASKDEPSILSSYFLLGKFTYMNVESKKNVFYSKKIIESFNRLKYKSENSKNKLVLNYVFLIESYNNLGNYAEAKKYLIELKKFVKIYQLKNKEPILIHAECKILESLGDHKQSVKLRLKNIQIIKTLNNKAERVGKLCQEYYNLAELSAKSNNILSAKKYLDSSKVYIEEHTQKELMLGYYKTLEADIALKERKLTHEEIDKSIDYSEKRTDRKNAPLSFMKKGELYEREKKIKKAIESYTSAKLLYGQDSLKLEYSETLIPLIKLQIKNNDSTEAIKLFDEFLILRKKIFNEQVAKSLSVADVKYGTELKEAQIKSQQLELEKEKTNRNVAISGVGFLLLLSGGGFWFFKNRQKQKELQNQNTLLGLQQNLNAMELQSLNKQLDPHEIKNLLASISPEIQEKAPESYKRMLKLFNVTKASLNNHSLTESIEIQTQQIEDFLSLEKSMLTVPFEYFIENTIQNKDLQIPRLMLKNLVENAIKHGIKGTEGGGKVEVSLFEKNNFITITVDDSGKGRQQAILSDSGIGTSTYQKLFATLNQKNKDNATFEIIDKEQGTKVEVKIPQDYKYN